jgi:hypothetical protein
MNQMDDNPNDKKRVILDNDQEEVQSSLNCIGHPSRFMLDPILEFSKLYHLPTHSGMHHLRLRFL